MGPEVIMNAKNSAGGFCSPFHEFLVTIFRTLRIRGIAGLQRRN